VDANNALEISNTIILVKEEMIKKLTAELKDKDLHIFMEILIEEIEKE
jgi:hypothetical protein